MTKAIFFDIDGTLVSFQTHKIPQSALDAIHRVRQQGIKIFIATGRPLPFINNLEGLEYDGIISVNGAHCVTADGEVISSHPVSKADLQRIVENHYHHPIGITFAGNDFAFACDIDANHETMQEVFSLLNLELPEPTPIEEVLGREVMQVIAFFGQEDEERLMREVFQECDSNRWHPAFTDCIAKGTSKASGIDEVCHYYGIPLSETMAFGDGGNDLQMLAHVAIGVAMGNASDEVKAVADRVTTSVDEDGIALVLNELLDQ
ncbi:MAG: Cof-type HAD-IIB family hydrolase [Bacteroidales bacterium]|nr:Cof-type HAD-IIB family hydrolase [Bacteroidales bacterium]